MRMTLSFYSYSFAFRVAVLLMLLDFVHEFLADSDVAWVLLHAGIKVIAQLLGWILLWKTTSMPSSFAKPGSMGAFAKPWSMVSFAKPGSMMSFSEAMRGSIMVVMVAHEASGDPASDGCSASESEASDEHLSESVTSWWHCVCLSDGECVDFWL